MHHAQIQQMFGSVDELVRTALAIERDRYMEDVFGPRPTLPDPLAIGDHHDFWRAIVHVVLDPGPVDLPALAEDGPVAELTERLGAARPEDDPTIHAALAVALVAAPLGALIFRKPLQRGLGIDGEEWADCWRRLGDRLTAVRDDDRPLPQPRRESRAAEPAPTRPRPDADPGESSATGSAKQKLVDAAAELLATRLETSVTGRELATAAGVNYGLINHYFSSKGGVFDEALALLHRRFLDDVVGTAFALGDHRPFLRAWASRLLGERPVPDFELRGMHQLVEQLTAQRRPETPAGEPASLDVIVDALAAISLQLGWALLAPLPTATGKIDESVLTEHLLRINQRLLQSEPT